MEIGILLLLPDIHDTWYSERNEAIPLPKNKEDLWNKVALETQQITTVVD
jgi:hypothetical protein